MEAPQAGRRLGSRPGIGPGINIPPITPCVPDDSSHPSHIIQSTLFCQIFPELVPQLPSGSPTTPIRISRMCHECISIAVGRVAVTVHSDFMCNDARLDVYMDFQ